MNTSQLCSLEDFVDELQRAQDVCKKKRWKFTWRNGEVVVRDVVGKVLDWVQKFKEVGDIIAQYDTANASIPWGAFRFLLQCALSERDNMALTIIGLEKITNVLGRCRVFEKLYLSSCQPFDAVTSELNRHINAFYTTMHSFLADGKKFYEKSTLAKVASSVFTVNSLKNYVDQIDADYKLITEVIDVLNNQQSRAVFEEVNGLSAGMVKLRDILVQFDQPIHRMDKSLVAISDKMEDAKRMKILKWLSNINYPSHHRKANKRTPGTCQWIFKNPGYLKWRKSSGSGIMWLRGDPGTGKTKLTSSVIQQHINDRNTSRSQEAFAYFYCDQSDPDRRQPEKILSTLLRQLSYLRDHDPIQPCVISEFDENGAFDSFSPDSSQCCELITELIDIYPQTTIVIDALDEVDVSERKHILRALLAFIKKSNGLVKIFVSSRNEDDIVLKFADLREASIHYISSKDNYGDICSYIDSEVENLIEEKELLGGRVGLKTRELICQELKAGSDGMFQWVNLHLNQLCDLKLEEDVPDMLKSLPRGLSNTYEAIYKSIENEAGRGKLIAENALQLVLSAIRPLHEIELKGALLALLVSHKIDIKIDVVLGLCHNLLVVNDDTVNFNHLSAREYLAKKYSTVQTQQTMLRACIKARKQSVLIHGATQGEVAVLRFARQYATHRWEKHAALLGGGNFDVELQGLYADMCLVLVDIPPDMMYWVTKGWAEQRLNGGVVEAMSV